MQKGNGVDGLGNPVQRYAAWWYEEHDDAMPAHVRFAGNSQLINFSKTRVIGQENGRGRADAYADDGNSGVKKGFVEAQRKIDALITRATSRSIPTGPNRG